MDRQASRYKLKMAEEEDDSFSRSFLTEEFMFLFEKKAKQNCSRADDAPTNLESNFGQRESAGSNGSRWKQTGWRLNLN